MAPAHWQSESSISSRDVIGTVVGGIALPLLLCSYDLGISSLQCLCPPRGKQMTIHGEIEMVAAIPHLPDELVLSILSHLLMFDGGFSNAQSKVEFRRTQRDLSHASRTCKLWYRIGTPLLYERPVPHYIFNFARTLFSTLDLTGMVKELVILYSAPGEFNNGKWQRAEGMLSSTRQCIVSCPQAALTLANQVHSNGTFLSPEADLGLYTAHALGRLRKLTLTDSVAPWAHEITGDVCLPELQELCLQRVLFPLSYFFFALPRLHTLRIIQCSMSQSDEEDQILDIDCKPLPSLRTLQIHEAHFPIRLCPHTVQRLVDLVYLDVRAGFQEGFFTINHAIWGRFCGVRSMTFVVLPGRLFPSSSDLLPKLEDLTIIVPDVSAAGWTADAALFVAELSKLLKDGKLPSLKSIRVVLGPNVAVPPPGNIDDDSEPPPISNLLHQCVLRGVELRVRYIPIRVWMAEAYSSTSQAWENYQLNQPALSQIVTDQLQ